MMIFKIDYTDDCLEKRNLTYRADEYSFDMDFRDRFIDIELALNKLTMSVVDEKVTQLSGFCGLTKEMNSDIEIPEYEKGSLRVEYNLEYGFAYRINDEDLPVRLNTETGWVCIGVTDKVGRGVEFIENCVAVISDRGEFLSLWLKPDKLPKLENAFYI